MQDNIVQIIGALKAETVGRCRERIEQASRKAKEIMGKGQPACQTDTKVCGIEKPGITEVLKRRHGL